MKHGQKAQSRRQALQKLSQYQDLRESGKLEEVLESEPEIWPHLQWIWDAFFVLHRTRQRGLGAQPIMLNEIVAYCRLMGVSKDDWEDLIYYLQRMDEAWLSWAEKKG